MNTVAALVGYGALGIALYASGMVLYACYYHIIFGRPSEVEQSARRAVEHYRMWRNIENLKKRASARYY